MIHWLSRTTDSITACLALCSPVRLVKGGTLGGWALIPDLDATTGHLPLGRYHATLTEVYDRFVSHPDFVGSPTRQGIWDGFIAYMAAWRGLDDRLAADLGGMRFVKAAWLGGSFISRKFDPHNLDVTLLVDGQLADSCKGKPGIAAIKKLSHRDGMLEAFK